MVRVAKDKSERISNDRLATAIPKEFTLQRMYLF